MGRKNGFGLSSEHGLIYVAVGVLGCAHAMWRVNRAGFRVMSWRVSGGNNNNNRGASILVVGDA